MHLAVGRRKEQNNYIDIKKAWKGAKKEARCVMQVKIFPRCLNENIIFRRLLP
jgi:hypothetical protein